MKLAKVAIVTALVGSITAAQAGDKRVGDGTLPEFLQQFDTNEDGKIDTEERQAIKELRDERRKERRDAIDTDGDGIREDDKGRKISFSLNTNVENNLRQQVGNLLSKNLISAGLDVNFKPIIFNDLVTSLRDSHKWDMILLGWGSGVPPDPANGKNITLSSGRLHAWYPQQPEPATEWEARVDELMAMMDEELDNKVFV